MPLRFAVIICLSVACSAIAAPPAPATKAAIAISASSVHSHPFVPEHAFDGDFDSRWASTGYAGHDEWLQIDFGAPVSIHSLAIRWERACALEYELRISNDANSWQTIHTQKHGHEGRILIDHLNAQGRYLRIECIKPAGFGLFSIWEVEFLDPPVAQLLSQSRPAIREQSGKSIARHARPQPQPIEHRPPPPEFSQQFTGDIIFAGRYTIPEHWYANFGYYAADEDHKAYGKPGGRLYRMNLKTGKVTFLIDDPDGAVRDPQVHYDGNRIIFAWRKGKSEHYNLYEINADGTGLRQITTGPWDDFEPTYLPDGGIMFVSSRCKRWVNCWVTQVAVLHRCDADGSNIRDVSSNNEHDNTPWVLPDGRIVYTRWEYVDRSQVDYHQLWSMNPDGTNQMVFFGNSFGGVLIIDAKPIPGSDKILTTFSPGHGQTEHAGPFYLLDPRGGPDERSMAKKIGNFSGHDPYPLSDKFMLYAVNNMIRGSDYDGNSFDVFIDPKLDLHEPRLLAPRSREPVIPQRIDRSSGAGRLVLADVHIGRNMQGVKRGDIKKLLILETLPKPVNFTGGMDPLTYGGSFSLERVVGTVPVQPDGSAYIELPALRSFFFVAMDENNMSVKRMQSFLTVEPGETTGCIGCHEQRTQTIQRASANLMALANPPSKIEPLAGIPEVFDFPRDIQPILDRHCVSCHDYDKPAGAAHGPRAGGVILTGDHGPMYSHSYCQLTIRKQFVDGRDQAVSNYAPRTLGTSASPLMQKLSGQHFGVKLSPHEIDMIRYWIEVGAPYPGTYAALGCGSIGGYHVNRLIESDAQWPASKLASAAIRQRCSSCHEKMMSLPQDLCDENGLSFWRPSWTDPRLFRTRHLLFNLSRPEKSLMLLAPLAKEAGGYGICCAKDSAGHAKPVFATAADADYQKILAMCQAGKTRLEEMKRFDMPGFRPPAAYIREMKRYGVLPPTFDAQKDAINPYDVDRRYWQSLWWKPE